MFLKLEFEGLNISGKHPSVCGHDVPLHWSIQGKRHVTASMTPTTTTTTKEQQSAPFCDSGYLLLR